MPVILAEVSDRVGTITLNRPERRNALDGELVAALDAAVKEMAVDRAVKVVVLTGAAAPGAVGGFCSGGDRRSERAAGMELGVPPGALTGDLARHDRHAAMLLHLMPKPTIAMVGGPAVGAGAASLRPATCGSPPTMPSSRPVSPPTACRVTTAAPSGGPGSPARRSPVASTC